VIDNLSTGRRVTDHQPASLDGGDALKRRGIG